MVITDLLTGMILQVPRTLHQQFLKEFLSLSGWKGESGGTSSHGMLWAKSLKGRFGFMSVLCRFHQTIKDEWYQMYQYYCIHTYIFVLDTAYWVIPSSRLWDSLRPFWIDTHCLRLNSTQEPNCIEVCLKRVTFSWPRSSYVEEYQTWVVWLSFYVKWKYGYFLLLKWELQLLLHWVLFVGWWWAAAGSISPRRSAWHYAWSPSTHQKFAS